jgi:hypothetical protein
VKNAEKKCFLELFFVQGVFGENGVFGLFGVFFEG